MRFLIDAGHGYQTPGKRSPNGMKEYEFNREVARVLNLALREYEEVVGVIASHSDERDVPLKDRTDLADYYNVDCIISIHANAYDSGGWNDVEGIETFIHDSKPGAKSLDLAKKVQGDLIETTRRKNRGVKKANFHMLREYDCPAKILVECGFMTNREEVALLKTGTYRILVGETLAKSVAEFYNLTKKTQKKPPLYRVQVGAFQNKQNAEELLKELKSKGYPGIIR